MKYFLKYCVCFIFIIFFYSGVILSQKRIELEKIRKEKIEEIEKIENIISETKHDKTISLNKIDLISKKILIRNEIIDNINISISDIEIRIDVLNKEISGKSDEINELKQQYAKIIYSSYYRWKNYNLVMFILSAKNFNEAYRRFYFLKQYTNERKNLINKILNLFL